MKINFLLLFTLSFICETNAQSVGIGTSNPSISAILEISSTTQGFLPPRMTLEERNSINTPETGLIIYCTNCGTYGGEPEFFNGTEWRNLAGGAPLSLDIGDNYGGGKVAYILQQGDPGYIPGQIHGLIAAVSDQSVGAEWGCVGTNISGAEGIVLGTGHQNTLDIVTGCNQSGIAARICFDLVLEDMSDWYLPSKDELHLLYLNKDAIGGFANLNYWSSSESGTTEAFRENFSIGVSSPHLRINSYNVRAIRSF